MKVLFGQPHSEPPSDDAFELRTLRYREAFTRYQQLTDRNTELTLSGGKPSKQARLDEECAFEQLDLARHALLNAGALAHPTIH